MTDLERLAAEIERGKLALQQLYELQRQATTAARTEEIQRSSGDARAQGLHLASIVEMRAPQIGPQLGFPTCAERVDMAQSVPSLVNTRLMEDHEVVVIDPPSTKREEMFRRGTAGQRGPQEVKLFSRE